MVSPPKWVMERVQPQVAVDVAQGDSHAGLGIAFDVRGDAEPHAPVDEPTLALVHPELIAFAVVGDEEIIPGIAVEVETDHTQPVASRLGDPAGGADIDKPCAVVPVQAVGYAAVGVGTAIVRLARAARTGVGRFVGDVVRDVEIQEPVVVDVAERSRRGPARTFDTGALGDVREGAIGVVSIKPVGTVVRDQEVEITVVVDVAEGRAHAVAGVAEPGFRRGVAEDAIGILAEQPVAGGEGRVRFRIGVYEIYVEVAVVVIVEECEPGSHRFRYQELALDARRVVEVETKARRDVDELIPAFLRLLAAAGRQQADRERDARPVGFRNASFRCGAGARREQRGCTVGRRSGGCRGRPCGVPARPTGAIENAHAFSYEATEAVLDFEMGDDKRRPYTAFVADLAEG